MRRIAMIIAFSFLTAGFAVPCALGKDAPATRKRKAHSTQINCLPPETSLDEAVSYGPKGPTVTVGKKLAQLKARCRKGKLVDAKGREIRFHRISCWGNPPADYQEIQQREDEALRRLQQRYTVIVFGCNPMIQ